MCDRKVSGTVKWQLYKTMAQPAMMYGIERISCYKGAGEKDASSRDENVKMITWNYKEGQN